LILNIDLVVELWKRKCGETRKKKQGENGYESDKAIDQITTKKIEQSSEVIRNINNDTDKH
jgi:hypothetical protein